MLVENILQVSGQQHCIQLLCCGPHQESSFHLLPLTWALWLSLPASALFVKRKENMVWKFQQLAQPGWSQARLDSIGLIAPAGSCAGAGNWVCTPGVVVRTMRVYKGEDQPVGVQWHFSALRFLPWFSVGTREKTKASCGFKCLNEKKIFGSLKGKMCFSFYLLSFYWLSSSRRWRKQSFRRSSFHTDFTMV